MSRPLVDIIHLDNRTISAAASTNTEFDIQLSVKRKPQEVLPINCHFVGVTCIGRRPTHFLITFDTLTAALNATQDNLPTPEPIAAIQFQQQTTTQQSQQSTTIKTQLAERGSLHGSIRRGSFDVRSIASENIRRTSLAKLSSLPLEAPITKVSFRFGKTKPNQTPTIQLDPICTHNFLLRHFNHFHCRLYRF